MKWISVEDSLPEKGMSVICYRPMAQESSDDIISVKLFSDRDNESWQGIKFRFDGACHVTHWMPLPEPPK